VIAGTSSSRSHGPDVDVDLRFYVLCRVYENLRIESKKVQTLTTWFTLREAGLCGRQQLPELDHD
jgi:hypothetical protein